MRPATRICLPFLILCTSALHADDTDIYAGSSGPEDEPMVMFSLDYRPNLSSVICTKVQNNCPEADYFRAIPSLAGDVPATGKFYFFDVFRLSLQQVLSQINGVKVGLMMNHRNTCNGGVGPTASGCSNGGMIQMGFESLVGSAGHGGEDTLGDILSALPLPTNNNTSHKHQGKELFFEFYRYLTGQGIYNGHLGYNDYNNSDDSTNVDAFFPQGAWDDGIETADASWPGGERYLSPLVGANACANLFTINVIFGTLNQEDDSDSAIAQSVANGGMGLSSPDFPDVIAYLYDNDLGDGAHGNAPALDGEQSVMSFFLTPKNNTTVNAFAAAGGTEAAMELSENPAELVDALTAIFDQIISVSTTFVPSSLPVDSFNRADVVDDVFLALFRAQAEGRPSWEGNLKKLGISGLEAGSEVAQLVDSSGLDAVDTDGRIRQDALTYWTDPNQLPPPVIEEGEVDGKDGRSPVRGGAGQMMPGFLSGSPGWANGEGGRELYFDLGAATLADLDATDSVANLLQADLNAPDSSTAKELIAFVRGLDIDDLDGDGDDDESRPWLLGDLLHSRPAPINYGARAGHDESNPLIFVATGSNNGFLHLFRNTNADGSESGLEQWAFMPRAVMGIQNTLRANTPGLLHPYGVDGVPVPYIDDVNRNGTVDSGEAVYLIVGLRRGGGSYYALDISDPFAPSLKWTISNGGDFGALGMSFSTPRVVHVDTGGGSKPALVFAAGYSANKDLRGGPGTDDPVGNGLYVVDLESGSLLWRAVQGGAGASAGEFQHPAFTDSVPSDVTVVDTDGDGLTDRALFGDSGGNVWRADLAGSDTSDWKLTRLAVLGRHSGSGKSNDRRFFHRPDFVQARDDTGPFDAVVIASGDRADPRDKGGSITDYLFMLKDRHIGVGAGVDMELEPVMLGDVTDNCLQDDSCTVDPDLSFGWRLQLVNSGEKALASPVTIVGTVYQTSYLPFADAGAAFSCEGSEGGGVLYAVSLQDATATRNYDETDDDPDAPGEPSSDSDRSTLLDSPGIPSEVVAIPPTQILRPDLVVEEAMSTNRWKTFWYAQEDAEL